MTVHKRWLIPFSEELVTWRQYVFIALMIVLILIVGVGDPATRELIYPASVATLVVVMEVIGFALLALGLVVQLTRFELGLGLVGLGLFCSLFAVLPIQFVAYPIVCYQTAVAAARLNFRRRLWLTIIIVGSLYASAYILIVPELFQAKGGPHWWQTLHLYNVILIIGAVIVGVLVTIGFFWLVGSGIRRRYQRMQDLEARADYAVVQERNRIAREMHDIIAHSLTVMIAQADGGKFAGKKNPDMAITALDTIGDVGRSALAEMRQLLSVLRETETPERSLATTPGVAGISDLIKETRRAGAEVDYTVTGTPHVLRESLGLSVFRIVQECLTNALKHGSANIIMSLDWLSDRLIIVVKNDLGGGLVDPQQLADVPGGRGLIGIAERAKIHGGAAHWGPHAGQWVVEVTLPLGE